MLRARTLAEWEADHRPVETFPPEKQESPPLDWEWERRAAKWYALVVVVVGCLTMWQVKEDQHHRALVRARKQQDDLRLLQLQPAPTVAPGPRQRQKGGKSLPTWVVKGAGDAGYDGTYRECGVLHGKPAYTNGRKWLWCYTEGNWLLTDRLGVADPDAPYGSCPGELPANPWVALAPTKPPTWLAAPQPSK